MGNPIYVVGNHIVVKVGIHYSEAVGITTIVVGRDIVIVEGTTTMEVAIQGMAIMGGTIVLGKVVSNLGITAIEEDIKARVVVVGRQRTYSEVVMVLGLALTVVSFHRELKSIF